MNDQESDERVISLSNIVISAKKNEAKSTYQIIKASLTPVDQERFDTLMQLVENRVKNEGVGFIRRFNPERSSCIFFFTD
ncbi:MAG: hypothetical protein ACKVQJ_04125 [Pyrinomonadaceae bacterium]